MPLDDLPIHFANTYIDDNETIVIPTDAPAQWDMLRWAKSRGGVFVADRFGPLWISGGDLSFPDAANLFQVTVSPVEGWALEEVNREERVALWAISTAQTLELPGPSILMFLSERGVGRIAAFPVSLPSPERGATYMEVPEEAGLGVPLHALMIDASGSEYGRVHDLRVPPFGIVYADNNDHENDSVNVVYDVSQGWGILRTHRVWWYAAAGASFEVTCTVSAILQSQGAGGHTDLNNKADMKSKRRLTLLVNQQLMSGSGGGSADLAGVTVTYGVTESTAQPIGDQPGTVPRTLHQVETVRMVFTSRVNAIHDICPAVFVEPGERTEYWRLVFHPQIWVRGVMAMPQFAVEDQ